MKGVLVLGAGGHGKVVADALLARGVAVLGFLDDDPATWVMERLGLPVLGAVERWAEFGADGLVMGIGSNQARKSVAERLDPAAWVRAVHPSATVALSARLGRGAIVMAGAVINPDTVIGDHVIVNTGATVDHDCTVGDYAHIAPGAHVAGGVKIGAGVLMGVGSSIMPGRAVGEWAVVGAGACVTKDVAAGVTVVGVPARPLQKA